MKKFTIIVLTIFVLFASCSKDETTELKDRLTFGTETFIPKSGFIETSHWVAEGEQRTTFHISVFDKNISSESFTNAVVSDFYGANYIRFNLDSTIENFDYRLDGTNCYETGWDFPGSIIINFQENNAGNFHQFEAGRFCITRKAGLFEIEFEGLTKNNIPVQLYYTGELFEIETNE